MKLTTLRLIAFGCAASCAQLFADVHYTNTGGSPETITIRKDTFSATAYESITTWENSHTWEESGWGPSGYDIVVGATYDIGASFEVGYSTDHNDTTWNVTVAPGESVNYGDGDFSYSDYSDEVPVDESYSTMTITDHGGGNYSIRMDQYDNYTRVETNSATAGYDVHIWY